MYSYLELPVSMFREEKFDRAVKAYLCTLFMYIYLSADTVEILLITP